MCSRFVVLCRELGLFSQAIAAIDARKFKAVNTREKNFTRVKLQKRIQQVEEHIAVYLQDLDTADRVETEATAARAVRLKDKIAALRAQMQWLKAMEAQVAASFDGQVSLTDPDARSMATSGRGSGMVGYNVQTAVDTEHHLIVAHEVVMTGSDRQQLSAMSERAKAAMGVDALNVLADRGYFSGGEILACEAMGVTPYVPKPFTSGAKAAGRVRQAGLHLPPRAGRLPLSGRRRAWLALHLRREGADAAHLLDHGLRCMPAQGSVHDRPLAADQAMGARSHHRRHAGTDGPGSSRHAHAPAHRGAPLRHDQSMGGLRPPADEAPQERENRDQSPRSGLQHEESDGDTWSQAADQRHAGLRRSAGATLRAVTRHRAPQPQAFLHSLDP